MSESNKEVIAQAPPTPAAPAPSAAPVITSQTKVATKNPNRVAQGKWLAGISSKAKAKKKDDEKQEWIDQMQEKTKKKVARAKEKGRAKAVDEANSSSVSTGTIMGALAISVGVLFLLSRGGRAKTAQEPVVYDEGPGVASSHVPVRTIPERSSYFN